MWKTHFITVKSTPVTALVTGIDLFYYRKHRPTPFRPFPAGFFGSAHYDHDNETCPKAAENGLFI